MIKIFIILISIILNSTSKINNTNYEINNNVFYIEGNNFDRSRFDLKYTFYLLTDEDCSHCSKYISNLENLANNLKNNGIYTLIVKSNKYVLGIHNEKENLGSYYIGYGNNSVKYTKNLDINTILESFKNLNNKYFKAVNSEEEILTEVKNSEENLSVFGFYGNKNSEEYKLLENLQIFFKQIELRVVESKSKATLVNYNNFKDEKNKISFTLSWNNINLKNFFSFNSFKKMDLLSSQRLSSIVEQKLNLVILFVKSENSPQLESFNKAISKMPKNVLYSYLKTENQNDVEYTIVSTLLSNFFNIPKIENDIVLIEFNKEDLKNTRVNLFNGTLNENEIYQYLKDHQLKYKESFSMESTSQEL